MWIQKDFHLSFNLNIRVGFDLLVCLCFGFLTFV